MTGLGCFRPDRGGGIPSHNDFGKHHVSHTRPTTVCPSALGSKMYDPFDDDNGDDGLDDDGNGDCDEVDDLPATPCPPKKKKKKKKGADTDAGCFDEDGMPVIEALDPKPLCLGYLGKSEPHTKFEVDLTSDQKIRQSIRIL